MEIKTVILGICYLFGIVLLPPIALGENVTAAAYDEPIEIVSDTLTVLEVDKYAIFNGHVVATQGTMKLLSDIMTVYYISKSKGANDNGTTVDIDKIEVNGDVSIITKEETAKGKRGVYDVKRSIFHLYDQVTLKRGQNTLTGDKFTYNSTTGKSTLTGNIKSTGSRAKLIME